MLDDKMMKVSRDAIRTRYTFLPFWYTLFYLGERDGGPVIRPLWVEFTDDKSTFQMDDQYILGMYKMGISRPDTLKHVVKLRHK